MRLPVGLFWGLDGDVLLLPMSVGSVVSRKGLFVGSAGVRLGRRLGLLRLG